MLQPGIIHYDIAAVVILAVTLLSLIFRGITSGPTSRVYISVVALTLLTALVVLTGELYDLYVRAYILQSESDVVAAGNPLPVRDALSLVYYALRSLIAPGYLVLIATVSSTSHRLDGSTSVRIALWAPMIAALILVFTNPIHHLVYYYVDGLLQRGPLVLVLYAIAGYYSAIGISWLIHWRPALTEDEFVTLLALYPLIFSSTFIQYMYPNLHIEMFIMSVAMMLVSAFIIRPEKRLDSLVHAGSLQAYRAMCAQTFVTKKPRCFVYLEIVNLEKLRNLLGKDELHNVVNRVAANLTRTLESNDTLYYLRDGLFCIVPRNPDADHARQIALKTHEEGKTRSHVNNVGGVPTMTEMQMRTCIVRVPEDVSNIDTLNLFIRRFAHLVPQSEVVMFSDLAKREGFALEMALSDVVSLAIAKRSFEVHYQPIWCVRDGRFHSAEALGRLNDPDFGRVSPGMFIPEAEQNGSIMKIGSILIEKTYRFMGEIDFEDTGLEYVEVNLSVEQCINPEMAADLIAVSRQYSVDPTRVNLEITETSSSFSQEIVSENMSTLTNAGFSFSLDDYGTGYSNAIRALSLPFSLVKIDKSFVDGMDDPSMRTILAETVTMMKAIGKEVLAEGAETKEQVDALTALGVDYIQGFYFSKPLPEDEFIAFLAERNKA